MIKKIRQLFEKNGINLSNEDEKRLRDMFSRNPSETLDESKIASIIQRLTDQNEAMKRLRERITALEQKGGD